MSIFERLEKHFGPDKFVSAAVIGEPDNFGTVPPERIIVRNESINSQLSGTARVRKTDGNKPKKTNPVIKRKPQGTFWRENGKRYREIPGQPYYITKESIDLFEKGLKENTKVGLRVIELLEKYKDRPFFFFVHFNEVDQVGPEYRENSKEYDKALISNDLWTGRIMAKVRKLGLRDKTQVYITAAHGFNEDEKEQRFSPYVFLATDNKQVSRKGRRQDVAPTIMEAFGLNLSKLEPELDGISLTKPDDRPTVKIHSDNRKPDVPYVSTPQEVVDKMLEMANVSKDDLVYDLGCGDGRFVVAAAKKYGCKAVGYDISPRRVRESLENVKKNGLEHLVKIEQKDIFTLDLSKADVITLFLLPSLNVKLIPQLDKLKPGSRIISYNFGMRGVVPDKVVHFTPAKDKSKHTIYMWTTPLNKVWLWKNKPPDTKTNRR
jgi:precorrin-6B methylase 2